MGVEVQWDDDNQTVLRYHFTGHWNWEEYFSALAQGRQMMKTVEHLVCIVNDFSQTAYIPDGFLSRAADIIDTRPHNTGIGIFIATSPSFHALHAALRRLYPRFGELYLMASTEEEAQRIIAGWRQEQNSKNA